VVLQDVLELWQAQQLVQRQLLLAATQVEQHGVKCIVGGGQDLQQQTAGRGAGQQSVLETSSCRSQMQA
jgi:hypothetical protein